MERLKRRKEKKKKVFAESRGPFLITKNNFYDKTEFDPHGLNENWISAPESMCYF